MGKSSQRKGADGERELAVRLREYGFETERGASLSFGSVPDLSGLPGIHIEVKRVERLNVLEAYQQAARDAEKFKDGVPALFHRRNRQPWLVTTSLDDWMALYRAAQ
jgi:Holliday junction resolvase